MHSIEPRLCVLTGIPGSGKTTIAQILRPKLPPRWTLVRGDDFIGVTQACYPGKPWEQIRRLHAYFAGWSAGWYLWEGRGVLLEGHFRDGEEIDRLRRGMRDMSPRSPDPTIVVLDGDLAEIARRLARNPDREREWKEPEREGNFRKWLEISALESSVGGRLIDTRGLTEEEVARKVVEAFGLPSEKSSRLA